MVALVASLLDVDTLALLVPALRGRARWTALAVVFTVLSLAGPITSQSQGSTRLVLALMHVTVGAVLIPLLLRTSAGIGHAVDGPAPAGTCGPRVHRAGTDDR